MLIHYHQLSNINPLTQPEKTKILQPLYTATYAGKEHIFKAAPESKDESLQNLRILSEAIYGKAAEIFAARLHTKLNKTLFTTPEHHLVRENGILKGVLTTKVPYQYIGGFGTSEQDFIRLLQNPGIGIIATLRYFFGDPDAFNNIAYDTSDYKNFTTLSSIDYGLANYNHLNQLNALLKEEIEGRPTSHETEPAFDLTPENIFAGLFQRMDKNGEFEFLAQHAFGSSADEFMENVSVTHPDLIKKFTKTVNFTFHKILSIMDPTEFIAEIETELCIDDLSTSDQALSRKIVEGFIARILSLQASSEQLRSSSPAEFEQLAVNSDLSSSMTKIVLSSSPHYTFSRINNLLKVNADDEEKRLVKGVILPANGGNDCQTIIKPQPLRTRSDNTNGTGASPQRKISL